MDPSSVPSRPRSRAAFGPFGASRPRAWATLLPLAVILLAWFGPGHAQQTSERQPDGASIHFRRDIEPIFAAHCWKCHGETKQKAGLRLDNRTGALLGADFGSERVILPGDIAGSRLLQVISAEDEDERMPPNTAPLASAEIDLIRRWIEAGADWPEEPGDAGLFGDHWAYHAPKPQPLPSPKRGQWVRNEIDRFVLKRLESEGLTPAPEASKESLLRRLCLDLTGLPPTLQQIERFRADESEGAYEALVERLLASPHYGERQARAWLDLARYADTNGYEKDQRRSIWRFRDWVIDAFNADMGFDQFTLEQLAGDLLPDATLEQRIATGFHRNTMINAEGGVDPEESRVAAVMDRVNTTGSVWLGSTLACAQCHTHKYDPFSHRDYYRLFAYFNSSADIGPGDEPRLQAPTPEMARREALAQEELAKLEARLNQWTPAFDEQLHVKVADQVRREAEWAPLVPTTFTATDDTTLALLNEGSILAIGERPDKGTYELQFDLPRETALQRLRLEVLPHPTLPGGGSGRSPNQNFVLSEVRIDWTPSPRAAADQEGSQASLTIARAFTDFHQKGSPPWPAEATIDGNPETGWAISGALGKPHELVLELEQPLVAKVPGTLRIRLEQNYGDAHMLGHMRFSASSVAGTGQAILPGELGQLFRSGRPLTADDILTLRPWFRSIAPELAPTRARKAELDARESLPTTLVMQELDSPRTSHVLERGSFLSPGVEVSPGVPQVLPQPPPDSEPNRLGLARWLTSSDNPLTARVTVNRLWEQVFGRGLVATSEDFGTQGERPSHPALLDWLALTFQADGWSTKSLLRRIVLSSTYRQDSAVSEQLREKDPQNRLLARGARYRVEAEMVRDIALRASGLLNETIGGPSVFPPQPQGVWNVIFNADRWVNDTGPNRFRRGLYTFWRRTSPYPAFMAFDAPSRELTCIRRSPSNTPLQALALLNDPVFVEAAVALAGKLLRLEGGTDEARIELGFQLCTGRRPRPSETAILLQLLAEERLHYGEFPESAAELIHSEASLGVETLDPIELAAWSVLSNVLLNLDETITRS